ncbi:hypothetical protein [Vibrio parahaemolyticus]|uniref:hypothetical protein n=1 Tax=Vibrio parahaemolyticus TaxID=670 RepID=UPI0008130817|nr:hypothetical protein [Vibrio parahaemolyticus]OCP62931.1 hypothetical protein AKH04_05005 [Vibrio parahaemolyticus]
MSDRVIKSSTATVQVGTTKADGKLELTESDLIFIPYNEKLGFGPYELKRQDIATVAKCLGKGGGVTPITTDAFCIKLANKTCYEFIVANPEQWIDSLGEIVS